MSIPTNRLRDDQLAYSDSITAIIVDPASSTIILKPYMPKDCTLVGILAFTDSDSVAVTPRINGTNALASPYTANSTTSLNAGVVAISTLNQISDGDRLDVVLTVTGTPGHVTIDLILEVGPWS